MTYGFKDSGKRDDYETGAMRDIQEGKPRYDLLPLTTLFRVQEVFRKGAAKYADRNWQRGMPVSRYYASLLRHITQGMMGETDEDHFAHAVFNLMAIMWTLDQVEAGHLPQELDDRKEVL